MTETKGIRQIKATSGMFNKQTHEKVVRKFTVCDMH